jgi:hypothetical protein
MSGTGGRHTALQLDIVRTDGGGTDIRSGVWAESTDGVEVIKFQRAVFSGGRER